MAPTSDSEAVDDATARELLAGESIPSGLRADLLGLAVVDPELLVEAIEDAVATVPGLEPALRRAVSMRAPTRLPSRPVRPGVRQIAFVTSRRQVVEVGTRGVRYPHPLRYGRRTVDVSVPPGATAVILGGCTVAIEPIASLLPRGGDDAAFEEALDRVSEQIASQFGGTVTQRALREDRTGRRERVRRASDTIDEDHVFQAILAIQGTWPGSGRFPRQTGESPDDYLERQAHEQANFSMVLYDAESRELPNTLSNRLARKI